MLVQFRVKNFRSIRDEQVLSMVASSDTALEQNCIQVGEDLRLLRTAAIYGPNASGKSNVILAKKNMRTLVLSSNTAQPGKGATPHNPFLLDVRSRNAPTEYEVTYIDDDGIRYQYGFSHNAIQVIEEWLLSYETPKARTLFHRLFVETTGEYEWKWGSTFKGQKEHLKTNTRKDTLFVSLGAQLNHPVLTSVYNWFMNRFLDMRGGESIGITEKRIADSARVAGESTDLNSLFSGWLRTADPHVQGIVVEPVDRDELARKYPIPDEATDEERRGYLDFLVANLGYNTEFLHPVANTDETVRMSLNDESDGTRRYFRLLGPLYDTIKHGITAYVDEIEASLHPLLTRQLVNFLGGDWGLESKAQLIFTTHDTTLLDPCLLRRDQVWFTEKDDTGATRLRPLSDYKGVRKGEALQKGYLSGRYGAIPIVRSYDSFYEP